MRKFIIKAVSVVMTVIIAVQMFTVGAYAVGNDYVAAIETARDNMVNRNGSFSVELDTSNSDYAYLANSIMSNAMSEKYATTSSAGDYLRWNYDEYGCTVKRAINESGVYHYIFNYTVAYRTTKEQEQEFNKKINETITSLNIAAMSDYNKVKTIHDYICDTVTYLDDNNKMSFTGYSALVNGHSVCQGYSLLFYRMCKEVGIDNRIIAGNNHSWNIVELDNKYYNIDCTWDDDDTNDRTLYTYFLRCNDDFAGHSIVASEYATPEFKATYPMSDECWGGCKSGNHTDVTVDTPTNTPVTDQNTNNGNGNNTEQTTTTPAAPNNNSQNGNNSASNGSSSSTVKKDTVTTTKAVVRSVKLSKTSYTYDGKVKAPSVTIKNSTGKTLKKGTDYTVSYSKGRKNVGKYSVKITYKGNYSVSKTLYFTINPKPTSVSKVSAGKKKFTVKWKKQTSQVTGYQVQYSTSSKFKSPKNVTVSKNSATSKTISGLKAKKKYYVRVRTYKTVNGKKYYSSWSSAKSVTTKK